MSRSSSDWKQRRVTSTRRSPIDLDQFDANAADLSRRATGVPVRVASKSVRVRDLVDRTVARQGFSGVMTFALREAIWLARHGHQDLLMGYPTVDRGALSELASDDLTWPAASS